MVVVYQKIYQDSSKVVYCPMEIELQLDSNTELTYRCFYDGLFLPSTNDGAQFLHGR